MTLANLDIDISSKSKSKEDDLVSFNDIMDACDRATNTLEHSRLSWNIEPRTQKCKQQCFSPLSSGTEYSSEKEASVMNSSPEDENIC